MPITKVTKKIVNILFIRLNTQSWIYESWIFITKFTDSFDLLKTDFRLRIKIDEKTFRINFQSLLWFFSRNRCLNGNTNCCFSEILWNCHMWFLKLSAKQQKVVSNFIFSITCVWCSWMIFLWVVSKGYWLCNLKTS